MWEPARHHPRGGAGSGSQTLGPPKGKRLQRGQVPAGSARKLGVCSRGRRLRALKLHEALSLTPGDMETGLSTAELRWPFAERPESLTFQKTEKTEPNKKLKVKVGEPF